MKRIYLLAALLALPLITSCAERVYRAHPSSAYEVIRIGESPRTEYPWDAELKK